MQQEIRKPATLEEQIENLKSKNLIIEDEKRAMKVLRRINYYRLSAYSLSLKEGDFFKEGVTFNQLYGIYEFDKKLRYILLGMLESVEVSLRNFLSYYFSHRYGSMGYLDNKNFAGQRHHKSFLYDLNRSMERNDDLFGPGHRSQYKGNYPLWVVIEVLSFGDLSKFFANMKNVDKRNFARQYFQVPYIYLDSWLFLLSYVRNICAHYGRLYNRSLKYLPKLDRRDKGLGFSGDKIFAAVFILGKVYPEIVEWDNFVDSLDSLLNYYSGIIDFSFIGFQENWKQLLP